jgi:hypothetical protein
MKAFFERSEALKFPSFVELRWEVGMAQIRWSLLGDLHFVSCAASFKKNFGCFERVQFGPFND